MIVDTSALIAILHREQGSESLADAIANGGVLPAPVLVEFRRVATRRGSRDAPQAEEVLGQVRTRLAIEPFTAADADLAGPANFAYGAGNGRGGRLNLLDLMVYAVAKRMGLPILCTGSDFASTDAAIHPASRNW